MGRVWVMVLGIPPGEWVASARVCVCSQAWRQGQNKSGKVEVQARAGTKGMLGEKNVWDGCWRASYHFISLEFVSDSAARRELELGLELGMWGRFQVVVGVPRLGYAANMLLGVKR